MNFRKLILPLIGAALITQAKADEGMWMLPLLEKQNAEMMKERGLLLEMKDIYNPDSVSLKDAVVRFGSGCTGEVISPYGLVLTNHHCGYSSIQNHSSVEHDYLTDGFWAKDKSEELPNPGLTVTFIDKIEDVTDYVNQELEADPKKDEYSFLSPSYLYSLAVKRITQAYLDSHQGIEVEIKPFYNGNKYYMFTHKVYSDIRLVGAPPSSIGKFGADTDNWEWPRHTGDFSIFRIYADKEGNPADYSEDNVPLKVKKFFSISLKGVQEKDFAMVMGFPGSTYRFSTPNEVSERRDVDNAILVSVRDIRQGIMLNAMLSNPKTRIQYSSKYASSTNSYKRSKGMNKMINMQDIEGLKRAQQNSVIEFAAKNNKPEYAEAASKINEIVDSRRALRSHIVLLNESFNRGIEFMSIPVNTALLEVALGDKNKQDIEKNINILKSKYKKWNNKNYDASLDRKIAKALIKNYITIIPSNERPASLKDLTAEKVDSFVDGLFEKSIYGSDERFDKFVAKPKLKTLNNDPMIVFVKSVKEKVNQLNVDLLEINEKYNIYKKCYVKGILEMSKDKVMYPDANLTLRLTYGNISSLNAADAINYDYYTSLDGVMEKEDSTNWEFIVAPKLKQLYKEKDFGNYSMSNGKMPVCFIANTHTTGGNSGSPVINAKGELIGTGFDRNWEGISGDIQYQPKYQRTLAVDIRYTLFIIEKYAGAGYLLDEMNIVRE